jgi:hypothetical protein
MRPQRRPASPSISATVRALVAGTLLIAAVGSCELPKPQIPSIGGTPFRPTAVEPTANVGARVIRA